MNGMGYISHLSSQLKLPHNTLNMAHNGKFLLHMGNHTEKSICIGIQVLYNEIRGPKLVLSLLLLKIEDAIGM